MKVRPELVNAPRALRIEAHPQIVAHQLLVIVLQLVSQKSVDPVNREMLAPIGAPFRPVISLHGEHKLPDGLRQAIEPFVVLCPYIPAMQSTA